MSVYHRHDRGNRLCTVVDIIQFVKFINIRMVEFVVVQFIFIQFKFKLKLELELEFKFVKLQLFGNSR